MQVNVNQKITEHLEICPHCNVSHVQIAVSAHATWESNKSTCFLGNCQNPDCSGPVFFIREHINATDGMGYRHGLVTFLYPFALSTGLDSSISLPDRVVEEFQESIKCMAVGALLSSMTMSRRVLQRCLKDKGYSQHRLVDQINEAKKNGTIPARYHEIADEIRHYGNVGAHPSDDKASCVTNDNCHLLIEFTKLIIEEFYLLPHKATQLQANRKKLN